MPDSVTITHLRKTFSDGVRALDDVSLEIAEGELFFLLGPSGCGKTTLLRSIAGFVVPEEGSIHIGTQDITRTPSHQRDTGMVFQSYALWPHLSIRQNVAFGLEMRKLSKPDVAKAVDEALAMVQMSEKADAKPNELSGGQQQRVALARALVIKPRCLLLDEPLSNLDAKLRLDMRQEIRRITKDAGITAIYVTHDQKEALSIADRMAILDRGRIQQVGSPREIYRNPATAFVAGFIGESNFLSGSVCERRTEGLCIQTPVGIIESHTKLELAIGTPVTLSIRPESIQKTEKRDATVPNKLAATCEHVVYLGESAQYLLSVDGTHWKRHEWNPEQLDRVGSNEIIWIHPRDVIVLQEAP